MDQQRLRARGFGQRAGAFEAGVEHAPLWQGAVHTRTDYTSDPKPMLFLDMTPNPTQRIVRAACGKA